MHGVAGGEGGGRNKPKPADYYDPQNSAKRTAKKKKSLAKLPEDHPKVVAKRERDEMRRDLYMLKTYGIFQGATAAEEFEIATFGHIIDVNAGEEAPGRLEANPPSEKEPQSEKEEEVAEEPKVTGSQDEYLQLMA